jgi:site-specific DNA-methyltransferase (adenine-specific)
MMNLIHGDCIEKLQEIADGSIDLIVTDPPYGIDYQTFRTKREKLANDDNLDWLALFAGHCGRLLKHEHHMYCFVDAEYSADFILAFRQKGFKLRNILTIPRAVKGNGGDRIFQQQFEFCLFMTLGSKDEGRKFNETKILRPSEGYVKDKRFASKD